MCEEKGKGATWARCRSCGESAHRGCIGAQERDALSGAFTCHVCLAYEADIGLEVPEVAEAMKDLAREIEEGCRQGLEPSSRATYNNQLNFVWRYAETAFPGIRAASRESLQSRDQLPAWVAMGAVLARAKTGAKSTVAGLVTAINRYHQDRGSRSPLASRQGKELVRAAKKRANKGRGAKAPMPASMVKALMGIHERGAEEEADSERRALRLRDRAWLAVGFCGLLRKSELCELRRGDLRERDRDECWTLYIRRSKTDPEGHGAYVTLAEQTRSNIEVGRALREYLAARDETLGDGEELPLFPAWEFKKRRLGRRHLNSKGKALADSLRRTIQEANEMLKPRGGGFEEKYFSTHSLRRGGATAMADAGVEARLVQAHGRWTSDCYKRYMEMAVEERRSASARL